MLKKQYMFSNLLRKYDYLDKLRKIEKKDDFENMANHFKITKNELFKKYLIIDTAHAKVGEFTVTPIRRQWKKYAGKYLPADATFDIETPCVFLDEISKKCILHNKAKPYSGKMHKCWEENEYDIPSFTEMFLQNELGWDGDTCEEDEVDWDD
jgi:hypothetical protein